jgi:hypothetical protein
VSLPLAFRLEDAHGFVVVNELRRMQVVGRVAELGRVDFALLGFAHLFSFLLTAHINGCLESGVHYQAVFGGKFWIGLLFRQAQEVKVSSRDLTNQTMT